MGFAAALDAIYATGDGVADGLYTPDGGAAVPVRVIRHALRETGEAGGVELGGTLEVADLRRSQVAAPAIEASLAITGPDPWTGEAWTVRSVRPINDGLEWRLVLEEAP